MGHEQRQTNVAKARGTSARREGDQRLRVVRTIPVVKAAMIRSLIEIPNAFPLSTIIVDISAQQVSTVGSIRAMVYGPGEEG